MGANATIIFNKAKFAKAVHEKLTRDAPNADFTCAVTDPSSVRSAIRSDR